MPWMAPATVIFLGVILSGVIVISLLGARLAPPRTTEQTASPPVLESFAPPTLQPTPVTPAQPAPAPAPAVAQAPEQPAPTPAVVAAPVPTPVPVNVGPTFLKVGNTDRLGAFIRREPRAGAPGIVALRDGIVVQVIGQDITVDGRVWKNVTDGKGNDGWTPAEYLQPSDTGF
jgi:hypothetical protein